MSIFDMTKEDFAQIQMVSILSIESAPIFKSIVIIPTNEVHESGYMCMEFVAVDEYGEPMFKMGGYSDVLHLDGIGGYGDWHGRGTRLPDLVKPKGWFFDCLPCGYIRLMCKGGMKYGGGVSDFEIIGGV